MTTKSFDFHECPWAMAYGLADQGSGQHEHKMHGLPLLGTWAGLIVGSYAIVGTVALGIVWTARHLAG